MLNNLILKIIFLSLSYNKNLKKMTKPGFVEKRITLAINEEASKCGSLLQRNAFKDGAQFLLNNLDTIIEKPFYVYVAMFRDSKTPIVSAHTRETLETLLDDYCDATATHNHIGKRMGYTPNIAESDYDGYYTYEIQDRTTHIDLYRTEYYDVYCVEFKSELVKTKITL